LKRRVRGKEIKGIKGIKEIKKIKEILLIKMISSRIHVKISTVRQLIDSCAS
jgi:hypothetical protein